MPLRKAAFDRIKVYRPDGCKYAEGRAEWPGGIRLVRAVGSGIMYSYAIDAAVQNALLEFFKEFQRTPNPEFLVVEVACDSRGVNAVVFEIMDIHANS